MTERSCLFYCYKAKRLDVPFIVWAVFYGRLFLYRFLLFRLLFLHVFSIKYYEAAEKSFYLSQNRAEITPLHVPKSASEELTIRQTKLTRRTTTTVFPEARSRFSFKHSNSEHYGIRKGTTRLFPYGALTW